MRRYVSLMPRLIGGRGEHCPCALPAQSAAPRIEQQGWGAWAARDQYWTGPHQITVERCASVGPDRHDALLVAFAEDAKSRNLIIGRSQCVPDVVHVELNRLRNPDSGGISSSSNAVSRRPARCPPGAFNKV